MHALGDHVRRLADEFPCLATHIFYSNLSAGDVEREHYDSTGYVGIELLKSLLLLDDYDFYLCGPRSFTESLYNGPKSLNVTDERIHYEFFGPGATLRKAPLRGSLRNVAPGPKRLESMLRRLYADDSSKDDDLSAGCVVSHTTVCFNNVVQLKYTPDPGRHPSHLNFVHDRLPWGIDKILRATGVRGQVHRRWDRTRRAEMVELPGVPDHTGQVRRSKAYIPCRYFRSANSGISLTIELCLIQDSDKAKPA